MNASDPITESDNVILQAEGRPHMASFRIGRPLSLNQLRFLRYVNPVVREIS